MTTAMLKTNLVAQTQGTSPKTTTTQTQKTGDVQSAARDLRDAITTQINAEAIRARAQAAAARATAVQVEGAQNPSTPPARAGRTFTIRTPDGETVVGVAPQFGRDVIPPQAVDITIAFFITVAVIIIGLPLARAFARRMDRRSSPGQVPAEISSQLSHLNQAVDAIALEVERISEGQRFTARLLSEQRDAPRQTLSSGVDR